LKGEGKMKFVEVIVQAEKVLNFLEDSTLTPDEKIAILDTASNTIRAVVGAEAFKMMWVNVLSPKK
jgi:hypothetical protein